MNTQIALLAGYDNLALPDNTEMTGIERDAAFIGKCLAANDHPRPKSVNAPEKGIWLIDGTTKSVVAGTTADNMRVLLYTDTKTPQILSLPR